MEFNLVHEIIFKEYFTKILSHIDIHNFIFAEHHRNQVAFVWLQASKMIKSTLLCLTVQSELFQATKTMQLICEEYVNVNFTAENLGSKLLHTNTKYLSHSCTVLVKLRTTIKIIDNVSYN